MEYGYNLRARYSEEEWSETPAERKTRMRFANQMKAEKTLNLVGTPDDRMRLDAAFGAVLNAVAVPKGTCPKCHKHIGRGIYGHIQVCKGDKA